MEQLTPLRLGVASPEATVAQLRSKGIALRGLAAALSASRRPRPVVLAVVSAAAESRRCPRLASETA